MIGLTMKADIMAKENGDWVSNLYQGPGRGSPQYAEAMAYGERCLEEKILPLADKRMEISGHSLGGGLAAAVCCHLDHFYPDVTLHAIIFNPAGVNSKAIAPATTSSGSLNAFAVKDEILTTLQSYTTTMPFIGSVFHHASRRLGMSAMPSSLGTIRRVAGKSPGGALGAGDRLCPSCFRCRQAIPRPFRSWQSLTGCFWRRPICPSSLKTWRTGFARSTKDALDDLSWYSTVISK
ncbi:hypothetical protein [Paracoccus simplex]|uniref:Fungal lipase-like domain-containing protein n=1 Tax=Paracoccus simplex TaxID=2086346 RepID=A0ABV7S0Y7_9RHOB